MKRSAALGLALSLCPYLFVGILMADGEVLPSSSTPKGYSLTTMLTALAQFQASYNQAKYYPQTPFQILFVDPSKTVVSRTTCPDGGRGVRQTGTNSVVVTAGSPFFVPVAYVDNSSPTLGTFPTSPSTATAYFFGTDSYGAQGFQITVDGQVSPMSAAYLAGPVQFSQPLVDHATVALQLGAFVNTMTVGRHTVSLSGGFFGSGLVDTYKLHCAVQDFSYLVTVVESN
jgi:hypothetical protein